MRGLWAEAKLQKPSTTAVTLAEKTRGKRVDRE
jgi:hypothetical protein